MTAALLIFFLSAISMGYMAHLLALPYRPEHHLVPVPAAVHEPLPDYSLDWRGLV